VKVTTTGLRDYNIITNRYLGKWITGF
jgi:hypothetical protein